MARITRSVVARAAAASIPRAAHLPSQEISAAAGPQSTTKRKRLTSSPVPIKRVKAEPEDEKTPAKLATKFDAADAEKKVSELDDVKTAVPPLLAAAAAAAAADIPPSKQAGSLQARKLQALKRNKASPFPDFSRPTPDECRLARGILATLHGDRIRPTSAATVAAPTSRAGCGDSPSVLDALVRTVLSQNTSDANSSRAKLSMDEAYGGSDRWDAIAQGGRAKLQETIRCGGLSATKSRVITDILAQVKERYGTYSLDHLFGVDDDDEAMRELISFQGVGPKTASCVLLFCLGRDSFAVDTHVWRITGLLGWRPNGATRDETYAHLDAKIPDSEKYALHILLVTHGKVCSSCKAGAKGAGKCELRKAIS